VPNMAASHDNRIYAERGLCPKLRNYRPDYGLE
jgi:hypothetical protein